MIVWSTSSPWLSLSSSIRPIMYKAPNDPLGVWGVFPSGFVLQRKKRWLVKLYIQTSLYASSKLYSSFIRYSMGLPVYVKPIGLNCCPASQESWDSKLRASFGTRCCFPWDVSRRPSKIPDSVVPPSNPFIISRLWAILRAHRSISTLITNMNCTNWAEFTECMIYCLVTKYREVIKEYRGNLKLFFVNFF